jgi:hypothetical protein
VTEVVVERDIAASPDIVYAMFTDPALLVRWLGDTAQLDPVPGGVFTHLTLTHRGLEGDIATLHAHGWDRFLSRLGAVVDGTDPGPDPWHEQPDDVLARSRMEP